MNRTMSPRFTRMLAGMKRMSSVMIKFDDQVRFAGVGRPAGRSVGGGDGTERHQAGEKQASHHSTSAQTVAAIARTSPPESGTATDAQPNHTSSCVGCGSESDLTIASSYGKSFEHASGCLIV
jgi:hypothetical protein